MTSRQLNIRLDPADRDRLEALAFVRRLTSSTLAREIVLEYVSRHENEAGVQTALAALAEGDSHGAGGADVRSLQPRNSRHSQ